MNCYLIHKQGHLSEALKSRLDYLRKPSGNKRGKGKSRKGISSTKTFPNYPATTATTTDDRPAHDRHVKQIIVQYKRSRPNKQVSKNNIVLVTIILTYTQVHELRFNKKSPPHSFNTDTYFFTIHIYVYSYSM